MSDLLECRKVLQQDGKRLFCDECGFESFIPDRPPKKERKPTMSEELATLKAENDRLRNFASQLSRIQFEEWHGHYQDGAFWIFDSEGEGIAKGKDAFEAFENMEKLK